MYIWLKSQMLQSKQGRKDIPKFPINFQDHHEGFFEYNKEKNIN